ncbi:MAG: putative GMC-type oxidoreductase [Myxococcota bacterium]|nr:putative GMC-type oxidoreductase [Myxococcota bacterium]
MKELTSAGFFEGKDISQDTRLRTEVCVIGSGAGGAVAAAELAALGHDVVVIEEGPYFPPEYLNGRDYETMRDLYREAGMTVAIGKPGIPVPAGKCVGGTTVINSGTCFRLPARTIEKWRRDHGLRDFSEESLAPYFQKVEEKLGVSPVTPETEGGVARIIRRGADKLGYSHHPLQRNAKGCEGRGTCAFGCTKSAKQSMLVSYLPEAIGHGARIFADSRAERLLLSGNRVFALEARVKHGADGHRPPRRLEVRADAFILAGGAMMTPVFLQKNRIGVRSGQVGKNLTIHPASKLAAFFDEDVYGWKGVPQGYCIDHFRDEGLMFEGAFLPPGLGSMALASLGAEHKAQMERYKNLAVFGFMVSDSSTGSIRPYRDGRAAIRYDVNARDMDLFRRGILILTEVFFAAGAKEVYPPIHNMTFRSMDEARSLLNHPLRPDDVEMLSFHPLGTARMGLDPRSSVVDPQLKSHEVENFYVVDGSIFPTSLGVNPQLTIMAFATRAAEAVNTYLRQLGSVYKAGEKLAKS